MNVVLYKQNEKRLNELLERQLNKYWLKGNKIAIATIQ